MQLVVELLQWSEDIVPSTCLENVQIFWIPLFIPSDQWHRIAKLTDHRESGFLTMSNATIAAENLRSSAWTYRRLYLGNLFFKAGEF